MTTQPVTGQVTQPIPAAKPRLTLRNASLVLIAVGIAITSYLTYVKATNVAMVCVVNSVFDCHTVQNSVYSRIELGDGGIQIPIAYLGLLTYLVLGALFLLEKRTAFLQEYSTIIIFGITLFAWLYSMWLVYLQVFRIQALCPWCLAHEVVITILFVLTALRLRQHLTAQ